MPIRNLAPALVTLALCALPLAAQQNSAERWGRIYAANNLDNEGYKPFHIVLAYQLYDLKGVPSEKGTVEEWWAAPKSHHVVITGPSFPAVTSPDQPFIREKYLVNMLTRAFLQPVPKVNLRPEDKAEEQTQKFGKISLRCLHLQAETAPTFSNACTEMDSDTVRVIKSSSGDEAITRNAIGKFHDVMVATKVSIGLAGNTAITGEIATLEAIDPTQHTDVLNLFDPPAAIPNLEQLNILTVPPPAAGASGSSTVRNGLKPGKILIRTQPVFPPAAKQARIGGAVILSAVITKDGSIRLLTPLAASDPVFIQPAMDAVQKWKYEPYLLNGEPTEVDTTITVNFNISR